MGINNFSIGKRTDPVVLGVFRI